MGKLRKQQIEQPRGEETKESVRERAEKRKRVLFVKDGWCRDGTPFRPDLLPSTAPPPSMSPPPAFFTHSLACAQLVCQCSLASVQRDGEREREQSARAELNVHTDGSEKEKDLLHPPTSSYGIHWSWTHKEIRKTSKEKTKSDSRGGETG